MAETFTIRFEDASSTGGGTGGGAGGGERGTGGGTSPADLIGADPVTPRAGATGPIGDEKWWKSVTLMQLQTMNRMRETLEMPTLEEVKPEEPATPRPWMTPGQTAALAGAAASGNLGALGGTAGSIVGNMIAPGVGGPIGGMIGGVAGNVVQSTPLGSVAETGIGTVMEGLTAVVNPVGTALDKLSSGLSKAADVASVFIALDTRKFEQSATEMISNVPLIGTAYARVGQSFLGLLDTIEGVSRNLSGFSPDLAVSFAMQDVRTTLRDLDRAQRLGPQLASVQDARYQIENKIADVLTTVAPAILQVVETVLTKLDEGIRLWAGLPELWLNLANTVIDWINTLPQWMRGDGAARLTLPDMFQQLIDTIRRGPDQDNDVALADLMDRITGQIAVANRADRNDGPVGGQAVGPIFGGF